MNETVFTSGDQLSELLLFCGIGFLLGAGYEVLILLRLFRPMKRAAVFLTDFLYAVLGGVVWFLFALTVNGGALQFYTGAETFCGLIAERLSVGRLIRRFAPPAVRKIKQILCFAAAVLLAPFRWVFHIISSFFCRTWQFFGKKLKKRTKNFHFFQKRT